MRISDWSSDVCSSDLQDRLDQQARILERSRGSDQGPERTADADVEFKRNLRNLPDDRAGDAAQGPGVGGDPVEPDLGQEFARSAERRVGKEWISKCRSRRLT